MRQLKTCRVECVSAYSKAIGYITSHPGSVPERGAFVSEVICARPECRKRAEKHVREATGQAPAFCPYKAAS